MASVIDVSDLSQATSRQRKLRNNDNNQAAPQRNLDVTHDNSDGEDYSDDNDDTYPIRHWHEVAGIQLCETTTSSGGFVFFSKPVVFDENYRDCCCYEL